jgi:hypothetical protein
MASRWHAGDKYVIGRHISFYFGTWAEPPEGNRAGTPQVTAQILATVIGKGLNSTSDPELEQSLRAICTTKSLASSEEKAEATAKLDMFRAGSSDKDRLLLLVEEANNTIGNDILSDLRKYIKVYKVKLPNGWSDTKLPAIMERMDWFSKAWKAEGYLRGALLSWWLKFLQFLHYTKYNFWIIWIPFFMEKLRNEKFNLRDYLKGKHEDKYFLGTVEITDYKVDPYRPTVNPDTVDMNFQLTTLNSTEKLIDGQIEETSGVLPEIKESMPRDMEDHSRMLQKLCAFMDLHKYKFVSGYAEVLEGFKELNMGKLPKGVSVVSAEAFNSVFSEAHKFKGTSRLIMHLFMEGVGILGKSNLAWLILPLLYKLARPGAKLSAIYKSSPETFDAQLEQDWIQVEYPMQYETGVYLWSKHTLSKECKEFLKLLKRPVPKDAVTMLKSEFLDVALFSSDFDDFEDLSEYLCSTGLIKSWPAAPLAKYNVSTCFMAFAKLLEEDWISDKLASFLNALKWTGYDNWTKWIPYFIQSQIATVSSQEFIVHEVRHKWTSKDVLDIVSLILASSTPLVLPTVEEKKEEVIVKENMETEDFVELNVEDMETEDFVELNVEDMETKDSISTRDPRQFPIGGFIKVEEKFVAVPPSVLLNTAIPNTIDAPAAELPAIEPVVLAAELPAIEPVVLASELPAIEPVVLAVELPAIEPVVLAVELPAIEPVVLASELPAIEPVVERKSKTRTLLSPMPFRSQLSVSTVESPSTDSIHETATTEPNVEAFLIVKRASGTRVLHPPIPFRSQISASTVKSPTVGIPSIAESATNSVVEPQPAVKQTVGSRTLLPPMRYRSTSGNLG